MRTFWSTSEGASKTGWRKVVLGAMLMSVAAAGCGGTEATSDNAAAVAGPADFDTSTLDAAVGSADVWFTPWTISVAASLVEQFGSEDVALDALFLSINSGYSTPQIRQALSDSALQADGSITAVDPSAEPLNVILQLEQAGEGEGALGSEDAPQTLAFFQDVPLPIERFRQGARATGAASANQEEVGTLGLLTIVQLVEEGFAPEDIVEIILFGGRKAGGPYSLPGSCMVRAFLVVDEWICPGGERYDQDSPDSEQAGDADDAAPVADEGGEQESASPGLRTWEGEWEIVDEIQISTTVDEVSIRIEEQPDGSFAWSRETLVTHNVVPGSIINPCSYVSIETSSLSATGVGPGGRLNFSGTRVVEYLAGSECFEFGGPEAGTFDDGAGGILEGDTISLDRFWDGVGPTVLDNPATS